MECKQPVPVIKLTSTDVSVRSRLYSHCLSKRPLQSIRSTAPYMQDNKQIFARTWPRAKLLMKVYCIDFNRLFGLPSRSTISVATLVAVRQTRHKVGST